MKPILLLLFLLFLFTGCDKHSVNKQLNENAIALNKSFGINSVEVLKEALVLNQIEGTWYYNNQPFSGYSVRFYPNDSLAERLVYINGKREGIARKWSENGVLRIESYYKKNRLDSVYKSWWENGTLAAQSNYVNGVKQGVEKEWYSTGQLAKKRQLVDGFENGLQKAWLENGTLYINYEAKNGRVFGLQRANSCYKLEDEIVSRDKKI